jgi:hypothetical protein
MTSARSFVFDPTRSATEQNFAADVVNYGLGASYALRQQSRLRIEYRYAFDKLPWKRTARP